MNNTRIKVFKRLLKRGHSGDATRRNRVRAEGSGRLVEKLVHGLAILAVIMTLCVVLGPRVLILMNTSKRRVTEVAKIGEEDSILRDLQFIEGVLHDPGSPQDVIRTSEVLLARFNQRQITGVHQAFLDSGNGTGVRDLCLGMAFGVRDEELVTFAASFRDVAPLAHLVLFDDPFMRERHQEIIRKYDIVALDFDIHVLQPQFLRGYHLSSVRWVLIQRFLEEMSRDFERVLVADVRDTLFQENPFDIISRPGLYAFMAEQQIGQCSRNVRWIRECFGSSTLSHVEGWPILYSGVTLGTEVSMTQYARLMSQRLQSADVQNCERHGVDQGLHNALLSSGELEEVLRFDGQSGPLVDVQWGMYKIEGALVYNMDGCEVPIVRGFSADRELAAAVRRRYVYWGDDYKRRVLEVKTSTRAEAGLRIEDSTRSRARTDSCKAYTIQEGIDLFQGICDVSTLSAQSLSICCTKCESEAPCRAFSYDAGAALCYTKSCGNPASPGIILPSTTSGYKLA